MRRIEGFAAGGLTRPPAAPTSVRHLTSPVLWPTDDEEISSMREYATAILIGLGSAVTVCMLFYLFVVHPFGRRGELFVWLSALIWIVLSAGISYLSGAVLAREVKRSGSLARLVLATPATYITLVFIVIALADGDPSTLAAAGLLTCLSFALTAAGFHGGPAPTRTSLCKQCRYDLCGTVTGRCPECGTVIPDQQKKHLAKTRMEGDVT